MPSAAPSVVVEEVTLTDTVATLWRYRVIIVALTGLAMLAVFIQQIGTPLMYEAVARAEVRYPAGFPPNPATLASFRTSMASSIVGERVRKAVGLDHGDDAVALKALVDGRIVVEGLRNTQILLVRGRDRSPERAAQIANAVVTQTILVQEEQITSAVATSETPREDPALKAETTLKGTVDSLSRAPATPPLEALRSDLDANVALQVEIRRLDGNIRLKRARLSDLERAATASSAPTIVDAPEISAARKDVATELRHLADLLEHSPEGTERLIRLKRAEADFATRMSLFGGVNRSYLEAVAGASRPAIVAAAAPAPAATLVMLDNALPPTAAISPKPVRNAMIAGGGVGILACLLVLLIDSVRDRLAVRRARASA